MSKLNKIEGTYIKHVYDIDLIDIYTRLNSLVQDIKPGKKKNGKRLLDIFESQIGYYCKANDIERESFVTYPQIIVHSKKNSFLEFFSWKLSLLDVFKIKLFLDHHFDQFEGNYYAQGGNFIGMVEHLSHNQVRQRSVLDTPSRMNMITEWIRENKKLNLKTLPPLVWTGESDLKRLSKRLSHHKCTKNPLDFYNAIHEGTPTKWEKPYDILANFISRLYSGGIIKCQKGKGYFKASQDLFVDYSIKSNKKIRLTELNSRIDPKKPNDQKKIKFVDKLLHNIID